MTPSYVFGLLSGDIELLGSGGALLLPLPETTYPGDETQESLDSLSLAPGAKGGVRQGFGQLSPLAVAFGTSEASGSGLLVFPTLDDAVMWERAFRYACSNAARLRNKGTGEEMDGWVKSHSVMRYKRPNLRKFTFTFQSLDPYAWQTGEVTQLGSPAVCANAAPLPAWPRVTCTAQGGVVQVSDGTRVLTITTTPGSILVIDGAAADGLVTDDGARANYSGRFPQVAPGGSTITVTGASNVAVRYRLPASLVPVISPAPPSPPPSGSYTWSLDEDGYVLLSGLTHTTDDEGYVVLQGAS